MHNNLKELLAQRGLTVSELSRMSGISQPTLHRIVNGQVELERITAGNFLRIAHFLGLTAEDLYFGDMSFEEGKRELDRVYATTCEEGRRAMVANARGVDAAYPHYDCADLPTIRDDVYAVTGY